LSQQDLVIKQSHTGYQRFSGSLLKCQLSRFFGDHIWAGIKPARDRETFQYFVLPQHNVEMDETAVVQEYGIQENKKKTDGGC